MILIGLGEKLNIFEFFFVVKGFNVIEYFNNQIFVLILGIIEDILYSLNVILFNQFINDYIINVDFIGFEA